MNRREWVVAGLTVAAGIVTLAVPSVRDFFDAHPGAVLAVIAVGAVFAVWSLLRLISPLQGIASATRERADSGQVRSGPIPVIAFELVPEPRINQFKLRVENVGTGPALGLDVTLVESPLNYRQQPPARGRALAPGGMIELTFLLEEEQPFRDARDAYHWPRNAEDAAAIREAEAPPRDDRTGIIIDPNLHLARLDELQERYGTYRREVLAAIAQEVCAAGTVTAHYQDLEQGQRRSRAPLSIGEGSRPDRPGAPELGTLHVEEMPPIR